MENWKNIFGVMGYEASDQGRLRRQSTGKILSGDLITLPAAARTDPCVAPNQHVKIRGGVPTLLVRRARLVCLAWNGMPPWYNYVVGFYDGDKTNYSASNLYWSISRRK